MKSIGVTVFVTPFRKSLKFRPNPDPLLRGAHCEQNQKRGKFREERANGMERGFIKHSDVLAALSSFHVSIDPDTSEGFKHGSGATETYKNFVRSNEGKAFASPTGRSLSET